jgi:hypothetical protein
VIRTQFTAMTAAEDWRARGRQDWVPAGSQGVRSPSTFTPQDRRGTPPAAPIELWRRAGWIGR